MANYNILIKNKSGATRTYLLYVSPEFAGKGEVFHNVYMTTPPVPPGNGTARFQCRRDYFAVTGTNPSRKLGTDVQVGTGDWGLAKICQGDKLGSAFTMTGEPGNGAAFDTDKLKQDCDQPGAFSIYATGFEFGNGANQFVGLGAQDPLNATNIVPVATFEVHPDTITYITPKPQYYISPGTYTPGQIIDVREIAAPAMVDFTGKAASLALCEHCADGTWKITFN